MSSLVDGLKAAEKNRIDSAAALYLSQVISAIPWMPSHVFVFACGW